MNAVQRETLRKAILLALEEAKSRMGRSMRAIAFMLPHWGIDDLKPGELDAELQYLEDKGFVMTVGKELSPENLLWRLTAAGRDFVARYNRNENE